MYKELQDTDWLTEYYVDRCLTMVQMAEVIGCSKDAVRRAMIKHGIGRRKHTSKYPLLNDKAWLLRAYVDEEKSCKTIANIVGCKPGLVQNHLTYLGVEMRPKHNAGIGPKANHWQGGRPIFQGYQFVYAPGHPATTSTKPYVQEHRLIMEEQLGRYLEPYEIVHHKDGDRLNNDPSNLEVKTRGKHLSDHFKASHEVMQLRLENENLRKRVTELEAQLAECQRQT